MKADRKHRIQALLQRPEVIAALEEVAQWAEACPRCGKPLARCNALSSPGCWRTVGLSRNGGPLLRLVDGEA